MKVKFKLPVNLKDYNCLCWYCSCVIKKGTAVCGATGQNINNVVHGYGYFCDWDCAFTDSYEKNIRSGTCLYMIRRHLEPMSKLADKRNPKGRLKIFGGDLTHQEWRVKKVNKSLDINQTWSEFEQKNEKRLKHSLGMEKKKQICKIK